MMTETAQSCVVALWFRLMILMRAYRPSARHRIYDTGEFFLPRFTSTHLYFFISPTFKRPARTSMCWEGILWHDHIWGNEFAAVQKKRY